jgi:acetyl-CoA decarbonylase/synthase complex subunit gamma
MIDDTVPGFRGWLSTASGRVPQITSDLTIGDRVSSWKLRWGMGRMSAIVPPGLYALGTPGPDDPVVVTANYKMSYDLVRKALAGRSLWLLVLETHGVNVWCAAGKGTFGTEELVRRIEKSGLPRVVAHRRLLLPILGATGIAGHKVQACTGFQVRYATIRAEDLPEYLDNGMVTTAVMRELSFTFRERLVLVPVELLISLKKLAVASVLLFLIPALMGNPVAGTRAVIAFLGAAMGGIVVTPLLLPWLPGRSFSVKGALVGLVMFFVWYLSTDAGDISASVTAAAFCAVPAVSAFFALNYTGCTPFTSRSGVKKEMRIALPIMGCGVLLGAGLLLAGLIPR